MINIGRLFAPFPISEIVPESRRRKVPPPITEYYPYLVRENSSDATTLISEIIALIADRVGDSERADITQDILLEIFAGRIQRGEIKSHLNRIIADHCRLFNRRELLSLDAPLNGKLSARSLYDLIDSAEAGEMSAIFKGGVNWQTRCTRYERDRELEAV